MPIVNPPTLLKAIKSERNKMLGDLQIFGDKGIIEVGVDRIIVGYKCKTFKCEKESYTWYLSIQNMEKIGKHMYVELGDDVLAPFQTLELFLRSVRLSRRTVRLAKISENISDPLPENL